MRLCTGSVIFLLYLNDPVYIRSKVRLFADEMFLSPVKKSNYVSSLIAGMCVRLQAKCRTWS